MEDAIAAMLAQPGVCVGVVGVGYVGLPMAVALAETGCRVMAYDASPARVSALAAGESGVETVAADALRRALGSGGLVPSGDPAVLSQCRAIIICVPTPLGPGRVPDLQALHAAAALVGEQAAPGTVVVLESTSYPGTTREVILPPLAARLGEVGQGFYLAFVPERLDPGNPRFALFNTPRVVGGVTPACTRLASVLYGRVVAVVHAVPSPEVAELAKLLENSYRNVNIALVNELLPLCERLGIDLDDVIGAAATKPFGYAAFRPGPGIGGECIPVDPRYLTWWARREGTVLRVLEEALDANDAAPDRAVARVAEALNAEGRPVSGSRVLLLGVAYKPGVGDTRNAPSLAIARRLRQLGADLAYHDPFVPVLDYGPERLCGTPLTDEALRRADLTVIVTAHPGVDYPWVRKTARAVLDLTHPPTAG